MGGESNSNFEGDLRALKTDLVLLVWSHRVSLTNWITPTALLLLSAQCHNSLSLSLHLSSYISLRPFFRQKSLFFSPAFPFLQTLQDTLTYLNPPLLLHSSYYSTSRKHDPPHRTPPSLLFIYNLSLTLTFFYSSSLTCLAITYYLR